MPKGINAMPLRVYDALDTLRALMLDFADAAAFVAILGEGAYVSYGRRQYCLVWVEGMEHYSASDSYDNAANLMIRRAEQGTFRTEGELKKWRK